MKNNFCLVSFCVDVVEEFVYVSQKEYPFYQGLVQVLLTCYLPCLPEIVLDEFHTYILLFIFLCSFFCCLCFLWFRVFIYFRKHIHGTNKRSTQQKKTIMNSVFIYCDTKLVFFSLILCVRNLMISMFFCCCMLCVVLSVRLEFHSSIRWLR